MPKRQTKPISTTLRDVPTRPDRDRRVRQSDRMARVLKVLSLIQSRGRWSSKTIAQEIGCSERTVYRDLEVLMFAGVPWSYDETEKCIRVRADFRFPTLNLTEEETIGQAIANELSKAPGIDVSPGASGSTRKIMTTSPEKTKEILATASKLIKVLDLKLVDHSQHHQAIKIAQAALLAGKQLAGLYESPYEKRSVKVTLHPYRLCLVKNAWYLIGHLDGEVNAKTFRIARFKTLKQVERSARIPPAFDLQEFFGNAWSAYRGEHSFDVHLTFKGTAAKIVTETLWHHTQVSKKLKNGFVEMHFKVDGLDEILNWTLRWTGEMKIESPEELKLRYLERLRSAISLNADS